MRTFSRFIVLPPVAALAVLTVLGSACGGAKPKARDASGRPVFDAELIRHPANEPYFCFSGVSRDGEDFTKCDVIQEWCARSLDEHNAAGLAVTGGCKETDEVHCYTAYASGGMISAAAGMCAATADDCASQAAKQDQLSGKENVSACKPLDRAFQPTS